MGKVKHIHACSLPMEPHPFLKGVSMRTLYSKRDDGVEMTCILVRCPKGSEIEEHVHPIQDDLIYVLEGEATMWIEGEGELPLTPGTFIVVPKGVLHKTFNVKKSLLIYDTFSPPIF
jgi:quercetin dioxygenase-like cupin family protein